MPAVASGGSTVPAMRRRSSNTVGSGWRTSTWSGGLAGGSIALSSTAGPIAGWGFFLLAVLWVPFTLLALASAVVYGAMVFVASLPGAAVLLARRHV